MIGTKAVYDAVMHCDLLLMAGTDYPYSNFLPRKPVVVQIDDRPQVLGRRAPTVFGAVGSMRPTLKLLLGRVAAKTDTAFFDEVSRARRKWDEMLDRQADPARSKDSIHPQAVARTVGDLAAPDASFIFDTGLNTLWSANWIRQTGFQRIIGSFNNAAVGTALGQANGIQALDRSRQVIALCGDGGFNMLMCEFLTAVHLKLPVKVVIYNNSAFGLIHLEAESVGLAPFEKGIQFPNPDFAALAHACGGRGFKVDEPEKLRSTIAEALACEGPGSSMRSWRPTRCPTCRMSIWARSGGTLRRRSGKPFWPLPVDGMGDGFPASSPGTPRKGLHPTGRDTRPNCSLMPVRRS